MNLPLSPVYVPVGVIVDQLAVRIFLADAALGQGQLERHLVVSRFAAKPLETAAAVLLRRDQFDDLDVMDQLPHVDAALATEGVERQRQMLGQVGWYAARVSSRTGGSGDFSDSPNTFRIRAS